MRPCALLSLLLFPLLLISRADAAEKLPVEAFARLPFMQQIQISPDGQRFAALLNSKGETFLVTRQIHGNDILPVLKHDNETFFINWFHWLNNERLAVSVRFANRIHGVAVTETRLYSIRFDGSGGINLMDARRHKASWVPQFQDRVIDWLPDDDAHVLVMADLEIQNSPGVYRININSGNGRRILSPREHVIRWITDQQHRVRVGLQFRETRYTVIFREPEGREWRKAWEFTAFSEAEVEPLGFGLDPNMLYVSAYHDGHKAVFKVDLRDPDLTKVLTIAEPGRDISGDLLHSDKTGEVVGISAQDRHGRPIYWDPGYIALARGVDKALPDTRNFIADFDADERHYIVYSVSDTQPGLYYAGDRKSRQLALVGETYPELPDGLMAEKQVVTYKARDGADIEAILTLPKGVEPKMLPAVVFPHGGPIAKDDSEFDYWTAFLANRGYVVMQMNFRGSSGYGHEFMVAGLKQWGLLMQDDLIDGVIRLIESGIVDGKRICIVGASYGGYAALMAAAKTPDMFKCAVSFAGVSDLRALVANSRYFIGEKVVAEQIGDIWEDRSQLRATSPLLLVNQIGVPILLAHGTKDRSVPFDQSRKMASALQKAHKPYRFIEFEDGDHHLSRYEHRLQLFREMESFLKTYLDH